VSYKSPIVRQPSFPHEPGEEQIVTVYNSDFSPGITGYTFAVFSRFSTPMLSSFFGMDTPVSLATLSRGYTAPSISISETTYSGYEDYVIPGKLNVGKELSIRFVDSGDGALMDFFKIWFSIIKPMDKTSYRIHQQMTQKIQGALYKVLYYGSVILFSTDPTLSKVTDAVGFIDIWPTSYPMDILNVEISNTEAAYFTMNFKVNRFMPRSESLVSLCENAYLPYYKSFDNLL